MIGNRLISDGHLLLVRTFGRILAHFALQTLTLLHMPHPAGLSAVSGKPPLSGAWLIGMLILSQQSRRFNQAADRPVVMTMGLDPGLAFASYVSVLFL
ncbi:MAG TPA: hypothetical protein VM639_18305 [Dongiaceae bacterium]|nr:hypothetical protein [Dongiaceae bacterium]